MLLSLYKIRSSVAFHEMSGSEKRGEPMASIRPYWGHNNVLGQRSPGRIGRRRCTVVVPRQGSVALNPSTYA